MYGVTTGNTKEIGQGINYMGKEYMIGVMEESIRVNISMI